MKTNVQIGQIFRIGSSRRVLKSQWQSEGVPFYRGREITSLATHGFVDNDLFISESLYVDLAQDRGVPSAGDIMITAIGTVGNSYIVRERDRFYFKDASVLWMKREREVNSSFINYWLKSALFFDQLDRGNGATVDTLTIRKLQSIVIDLPKIDMQRRIVAILDEAFAAIATAKTNTEKNLQNAREVFESQLDALFTKRNRWSRRRLGELCEIARGGSPRPIKAFLTDDDDGVNWIKIGDASASKKYIYETAQKIKPEGIARSRLVRDGDFLLSNSMSFGRPYIMRTSGCIHDGWLVLSKYQETFDQDFLYYLLGSREVFNQFDRLAAGSTVRNLNIALVSSVEVPVPPLDEQRGMTLSLERLSGLVESLEGNCQNKLAALDKLKQSLLHQAFTGALTAKTADRQLAETV